jgi:demethylmenaquinone methyltransferase/2-methoxy-6-polyprenyl-1,4-benzoquinol methylase
MSQQIQEMFSNIAETYDSINHILSLNQDMRWRSKAINWMFQKNGNINRVLDLCSGTGDFSRIIKTEFPQIQMVLVDFSIPMLKLALKKLENYKNIQLINADALNLPFCDMSFDGIVCGFGVRNLDKLNQGVHEMARILKPGGVLTVLDFFKPKQWLLNLQYLFYLDLMVPWIGGMLSGNRTAYSYLPKSAKNFIPVREFQHLLETNGFINIEIKKFILGATHCVSAVKK